EVKYELEGQALIIRFNKLTNYVDIITDTIGVEQVYYCITEGGLLLSNSLKLIEDAGISYQMDHRGISYYMGIGWIASDCTLREGVKLIPSGQHWQWDNLKHSLNKKTYFDIPAKEFNTKEALSSEN